MRTRGVEGRNQRPDTRRNSTAVLLPKLKKLLATPGTSIHGNLPRNAPPGRGQADFDRGVALDGLSAPLAGRHGMPVQLGVEPDRQRATALQRFVTGPPVLDLVSRGCCSAQAIQLSRWSHEMNPPPDVRNRATRNTIFVSSGLFRETSENRSPEAPSAHLSVNTDQACSPLVFFQPWIRPRGGNQCILTV
jgi:hypothetical protein